jgi:hypothetical protein
MDCTRWREFLTSSDEIGDDDQLAWNTHGAECAECQEHLVRARVTAAGDDPDRWPCLHIAGEMVRTCEDHDDPRECPDALLVYTADSGSYGLPVRTGRDAEATSIVAIGHCPWCGVGLTPPRD